MDETIIKIENAALKLKKFVIKPANLEIPKAGFRPVAHLHHHILGENVLAAKKRFQGALSLGKRPFPLVEHRENGDCLLYTSRCV